MTDEQVKQYLKDRGCSYHVWNGGAECLVEQWRTFVNEVEEGYCPDCLIDEYWNDLDTRELIHDIGRDDQVRELDARLKAMLIETTIKHHFIERTSSYDFWNYGYPKNASGCFYEQIEHHILRRP